MALANITNVNPYRVDRSANVRAAAQAGASIGSGLTQFAGALEKAEERRRLDAERKEAERLENLDIEEREHKKATDTFGSLIETTTNNGLIGQQLQNMAFEDKKSFISHQKKMRKPGVSNEERAKLREDMDRIANRAKTTASAFTKLQQNADAWNTLSNTEGISNATPRNIRDFMQDIISRENQDGYQVVDEEGRTKLVGKTSGGYDVDFYLDEIAAGANEFRAVPKFNKDDYIDKLIQDIPQEVKVIENEYGLAQQNDAELMGEKAATAIMDTLTGEDTFRAVAADYGFGYDKMELLDAGEGLPLDGSLTEEEIAKIDTNGDGYVTDQNELKSYLANQLLLDLGDKLPSGFKQINTAQYSQDIRSEAQAETDARNQAIKEANAKKEAEINQAKASTFMAVANDPKRIQEFKSRKTSAGVIQGIKNEDGKITVVFQGHTKRAPKGQKFDLNNPAELVAFGELMGYSKADLANARKSTSHF